MMGFINFHAGIELTIYMLTGAEDILHEYWVANYTHVVMSYHGHLLAIDQK